MQIPPADVILASECIYSGVSVSMDLFETATSPAREFENHSNLVGVLAAFLKNPGGVANFFVNQVRKGMPILRFCMPTRRNGP